MNNDHDHQLLVSDNKMMMTLSRINNRNDWLSIGKKCKRNLRSVLAKSIKQNWPIGNWMRWKWEKKLFPLYENNNKWWPLVIKAKQTWMILMANDSEHYDEEKKNQTKCCCLYDENMISGFLYQFFSCHKLFVCWCVCVCVYVVYVISYDDNDIVWSRLFTIIIFNHHHHFRNRIFFSSLFLFFFSLSKTIFLCPKWSLSLWQTDTPSRIKLHNTHTHDHYCYYLMIIWLFLKWIIFIMKTQYPVIEWKRCNNHHCDNKNNNLIMIHYTRIKWWYNFSTTLNINSRIVSKTLILNF